MGRKSIFMLVAPTNEKAAHMALAMSVMFPGIVLFLSPVTFEKVISVIFHLRKSGGPFASP